MLVLVLFVMFKLKLPDAIGKFNSYLRLLRVKDLDLNKMLNSKYYYQNIVCSSLTNIRGKNFDDEVKVLLYCMMTDPKTYNKYGSYSDFYDSDLDKDTRMYKSLMYKPITWRDWEYEMTKNMNIEILDDELIRNRNAIEKEVDSYMKKRIMSQRGFIEKIRQMDDKEILIKNEDIENYEKFLNLIRSYKGHRFVPTLRIDMVWHGHMLDNIDYVKSTWNYFGKMLIHNDDISHEMNEEERLEKDFRKTGVLWKKEYGTDYVKKNQSNNSSSCGIDPMMMNSSNSNLNNCSNCTSCSSCSSGCGN